MDKYDTSLRTWTDKELSKALTTSLYQHIEQRGPNDTEWEEMLQSEIDRRQPKHSQQCFEYHDRGLSCGCLAELTRR